jgi:hypothetical protein
MKKTLYILFAAILFGCNADIKENVNYLWDNGNYDVFPFDELIRIGNISAIDTLKVKLNKFKPEEFSLDVYPYQFGPEYNLKNELIVNVHEDKNNWPLGFLTEFSFIEKLSIGSVCRFTFHVNTKNNLKHFKLSSHSCERINADEPIHFDKLNKLESLHISRYLLSSSELNGISKIKKLEALTLTDCELDLENLINLKGQLRYLNLSDSKVLNWHLLSEFKHLEVLYIANIQNVSLRNNENINFLSGLKKLQELSVKRNSINTLEFAKNLDNLKKLYIQKTEIKVIPIQLQREKELKIIK